MRILFVCTGNTCRSPMAQGLAQKYFPEGTEILSAGLHALPGDKVSDNAVSALKEHGIDISGHTATRLHKELLESADYVFTMTKAQQQYLTSSYPEYADKIMTLGGFLGIGKDISDPWGGSLEDYRVCAQELQELIARLAESIKK